MQAAFIDIGEARHSLIKVQDILPKVDITKEKQQEKVAYTELIQKIGNGEIERIELSENSNSAKIKIKNVEEEEKIQVPNRQAFIELIQDEIKERQLC